jgi:TonB family protein
MFTNRALGVTFLISFGVHAAIVAQNPGYLFFSSPREKSRNIEISYIKKPAVKKQEQRKTMPMKNEPLLDLSSRVSMNKRNPPPFIDRDASSKSNLQAVRKELPFERPALIKPDIIAIKKKITLPAVDLGKIGSPSYISYYQIVREKIRRAAYQNYNRNDTGEVYITFIISSAGYLKDVRLIEEKSVAAEYLKVIALNSVKNASPFPNFPKELDYPQLSFNVVISFEVE